MGECTLQEEKKETILKEIAFWKTNKLLPEHYCDFLTTLYTGGDEDEEETQKKKGHSSKAWLIYVVGALLALFIIVAMYVLSAQYILIPIGMSVVAICIILYVTFKGTSTKLMKTLTYAVAALLIFALTVRLVGMFSPDNTLVMYSVLIANCMLWLISGTKMRLIYFTISGYLGLAIIILFGFFL